MRGEKKQRVAQRITRRLFDAWRLGAFVGASGTTESLLNVHWLPFPATLRAVTAFAFTAVTVQLYKNTN
jgi:hypothetical protein